jgi:hypothetical protein
MHDDGEFPSGPWTGFYHYGAASHRHQQDLQLTFEGGRMRGTGSDDVGRFSIRGHYDGTAREVRWVKSYLGAHDVHYRGFRDGKGIWGTWEITSAAITFRMRGGFHIWPLAAGAGAAEAAAEEAPLADERPLPASAPDAGVGS